MNHTCGSLRDQPDAFDHSSDPNFVAYYAAASANPHGIARFSKVRDKALGLMLRESGRTGPFDVADIGCGAGTQAFVWRDFGHRVAGLDVSEPLIQVARQRAQERGTDVRFEVGTATALPYENETFDIVLLTELLEHVADWERCVTEALRVLRPGGVLYLSTTNALCPMQEEYRLPMYSWYPAVAKRYCERLAVTTHPQIASHARYPAVHWFTSYELSRYLAARGAHVFDRFDMMDANSLGAVARFSLCMCRSLPVVRFLGHMALQGTIIFAMTGRQRARIASPTRHQVSHA